MESSISLQSIPKQNIYMPITLMKIDKSDFSRSVHFLRLGDSWNYIPPIFVSSSAKPIATHILVIVKLSGTKDFILGGFVCDINVPARNYLFKVSNWSTRIRYENCSKLRIKTLERCKWRHSKGPFKKDVTAKMAFLDLLPPISPLVTISGYPLPPHHVTR